MSRPTSAQRGYDSKWRRYRESYLRLHPLCVFCARRGQTSGASVVDHIVKPRDTAGTLDHRLFWNPENHQALCKPCHDIDKQRLEKSGAVAGCDERGVPIDPRHHWARPGG